MADNRIQVLDGTETTEGRRCWYFFLCFKKIEKLEKASKPI